MSPVKVIKDGQMVDRSGGSGSIGAAGRTVALGYTTIEVAGAIIDDDQLDDALVERVKAGEGPDGLAYFDTVEEAQGDPVDLTPEAQPPQNDQALNPTNTEVKSEFKDDPAYDPDKHNQAQVLEYLKSASPNEVERVKKAEKSGQDRQQIAAYNSSPFEG